MTSPLPPCIQQMLLPNFYDHPVCDPIRLIQTHISYVLLTGDYAYKVKKNIKFGFLDFSTLAQRHHYCLAELRLNRRLSPNLYLAVLPISKIKQAYCLNADQSVVEYALKMRQFDQNQLFSALFQQEQLKPDDLKLLAQQVAEFHATAETNSRIQSFGTMTAVRAVEENNFRLSQPFIGRTQTLEQFNQTRDFAQQVFRDHADWFEARLRANKIRECHGDLHLNNICRYQGEIQIFDCIEFNQEFRNIDVLYDAAFLVMDLAHQGRADLAMIFLNAYLEKTGDYDGATLLPLYLSMRATIRGNVNSLALDDPAIAPEQKAEFRQKATGYYKQAWHYTQQSQGRLYLMSGLSGSGKSTVAKALAPRINCIHIRSDAVRKHLAGIPLQERGTTPGAFKDGIYTPEITEKTYARLLALGLLLSQNGWTVILDAKYDQQALRQKAIAAATKHQIPIKILHCVAPVEVIRDRLRSRTGDITDATVEILENQLALTEPFTEFEQAYVNEIDTCQHLMKQLEWHQN